MPSGSPGWAPWLHSSARRSDGNPRTPQRDWHASGTVNRCRRGVESKHLGRNGALVASIYLIDGQIGEYTVPTAHDPPTTAALASAMRLIDSRPTVQET